MSFKITYHDEEKIIEVRLLVNFDWNVMSRLAPELTKIIKEKNSNLIIIDFRKTILNLSTYEIYQTPVKLFNEFNKYGVNLLQMKRAFIIDEESEEFHFFETVTLNRGQTTKIFYDIDAAKEWLLKD